jgi:hypothetical protein
VSGIFSSDSLWPTYFAFKPLLIDDNIFFQFLASHHVLEFFLADVFFMFFYFISNLLAKLEPSSVLLLTPVLNIINSREHAIHAVLLSTLK